MIPVLCIPVTSKRAIRTSELQVISVMAQRILIQGLPSPCLCLLHLFFISVLMVLTSVEGVTSTGFLQHHIFHSCWTWIFQPSSSPAYRHQHHCSTLLTLLLIEEPFLFLLYIWNTCTLRRVSEQSTFLRLHVFQSQAMAVVHVPHVKLTEREGNCNLNSFFLLM